MPPNQKKILDIAQTLNLDVGGMVKAGTAPVVLEISSQVQQQVQLPAQQKPKQAHDSEDTQADYWLWETPVDVLSTEYIVEKLTSNAAAATKSVQQEAVSSDDYWNWESGPARVKQEREVQEQVNYWNWETPVDLVDEENQRLTSTLLVEQNLIKDAAGIKLGTPSQLVKGSKASKVVENYWDWSADPEDEVVSEEEDVDEISSAARFDLTSTQNIEDNLMMESSTVQENESYWAWDADEDNKKRMKELYRQYKTFPNPLSTAFIEHQLCAQAAKRLAQDSDDYWKEESKVSDDLFSSSVITNMLVNNAEMIREKKLSQIYWTDEGADVIMGRANQPKRSTNNAPVGSQAQNNYWRWE